MLTNKTKKESEERPQKHVMFQLFDSPQSKKAKPKTNKPRKCTKPKQSLRDQVYDAYKKDPAIPDFDEIEKYQLTVTPMNPNRDERQKQPSPTIREILRPFIDSQGPTPKFIKPFMSESERRPLAAVDRNTIGQYDQHHSKQQAADHNTVDESSTYYSAIDDENANESVFKVPHPPEEDSRYDFLVVPLKDNTGAGDCPVVKVRERIVTAGLGANRVASTPTNARSRVRLRTQLSPIEGCESPDSQPSFKGKKKSAGRTNLVAVHQDKISSGGVFRIPLAPIKTKSSDVIATEEHDCCVRVEVEDQSKKKRTIESNNSDSAGSKTLVQADSTSTSAGASKISSQGSSELTVVGKNATSSRSSSRRQENTTKDSDATKTMINSKTLSQRTFEVSNFAPRIESTPLGVGRSRADLSLMLKHPNYYVDMSKLDVSLQKYITAKDFSNRRSTISIIPVYEPNASKQDNVSTHMNMSTNQYYRKSVMQGKGLNASCLGQRTVIWDNSDSHSSRNDRNKTMHQTLVRSRDDLFKFSFAFNPIISVKEKVPLSVKQKVLAVCQQDNVIDFERVFSKAVLDKVKKIGEGSYGEVFSSVDEKGQEFVIKIVALDMDLEENEMFSQILPEMTISATFNQLKNNSINSTPNFIDLKKVNCVRGRYPDKLLKEWNKYDHKFESENPDPDEYSDDQLFIVFQLVNGGQDLEKLKLKSAVQAMSIFIQLTLSLAVAERQFEFEHRDLHWGNVLVKATTEEQLKYRVDRTVYTVDSSKQLVSIIDFSLSRMKRDGFIIFDDLSKYEDLFTGQGDFQFEVYRMMRMATDGCWAQFYPVTNIFWLRYILDKLVTAKEFSKAKRSAENELKHQTCMKRLRELCDSVSDFTSVVELINSDRFKELPGVEVREG